MEFSKSLGRPGIARRITTNDQLPHTKVSLFRVKYPGLELVQQYYRFDFQDAEDTVYVDGCPGCGRKLKYLTQNHKCDGNLLPEPIDPRYLHISSVGKPRRTSELAFQEYLSKLEHKVHISE